VHHEALVNDRDIENTGGAFLFMGQLAKAHGVFGFELGHTLFQRSGELQGFVHVLARNIEHPMLQRHQREAHMSDHQAAVSQLHVVRLVHFLRMGGIRSRRSDRFRRLFLRLCGGTRERTGQREEHQNIHKQNLYQLTFHFLSLLGYPT